MIPTFATHPRLSTRTEQFRALYYQVAIYFTLSMLDDAALLALIFF
jgi:hypothetical protein